MKSEEAITPKYFPFGEEEPTEKTFLENIKDSMKMFLIKIPGLMYIDFFNKMLTPKVVTLTRYIKRNVGDKIYWVEDESLTWTGKNRREPDEEVKENGKKVRIIEMTSPDAVISYRSITPRQFESSNDHLCSHYTDPTYGAHNPCRDKSISFNNEEFYDQNDGYSGEANKAYQGKKFNYYIRTTICKNYAFTHGGNDTAFRSLNGSPVKIVREIVVLQENLREYTVRDCLPIFAQAWPQKPVKNTAILVRNETRTEIAITATANDYDAVESKSLKKHVRDILTTDLSDVNHDLTKINAMAIEAKDIVMYKVQTSYREPAKEISPHRKISKDQLNLFLRQHGAPELGKTTIETKASIETDKNLARDTTLPSSAQAGTSTQVIATEKTR